MVGIWGILPRLYLALYSHFSSFRWQSEQGKVPVQRSFFLRSFRRVSFTIYGMKI